jgi:hypothetical protein
LKKNKRKIVIEDRIQKIAIKKDNNHFLFLIQKINIIIEKIKIPPSATNIICFDMSIIAFNP